MTIYCSITTRMTRISVARTLGSADTDERVPSAGDQDASLGTRTKRAPFEDRQILVEQVNVVGGRAAGAALNSMRELLEDPGMMAIFGSAASEKVRDQYNIAEAFTSLIGVVKARHRAA